MGEKNLKYPISVDPQKFEATVSFDVFRHLYEDIRDYAKKP
jgi:hypothetical protein